MNLASNIIESVTAKIIKESRFLFIRKSDGEAVLTTGWYWMIYSKKKKQKEIDYYTADEPFYTKHMKLDRFLSRHEFVCDTGVGDE